MTIILLLALFLISSFVTAQRVCSFGESPLTSSCVFCNSSSTSCNSRGTCTSTALFGNVSLAVCQCEGNFLPPACALPIPNRLCDPNNASDVPSASNQCAFCLVGSSSTCANGGTCYYQVSSFILVFIFSFLFCSEKKKLLFQPQGISMIPVCGCSYFWAPPTCLRPSPRRRICDPTVPSDAPPNCEYCRPGLPPGENGCLNMGFCTLRAVTTPGAPPNTEIPICSCQPGPVAPQCLNNFMVAFGRSDLISLRWFYFAIFITIMVLALLTVAQHLYYGIKFKFTLMNVSKCSGKKNSIAVYLCT